MTKELEKTEFSDGATSTEETDTTVAEKEKETPKTFTQEQLDEIVTKRIARESKKFADYDELKAKLAEVEKANEEKRLADLSETEKAKELADKIEAEKSDLLAQLEAERKARANEKITNAFIKAASSANIEHIDDAIKLTDMSALTIDENGDVNGVSELIAELVEHKPYLLATKKTQVTIGTTAGTTATRDTTDEQLLEEAAKKARETGRTSDKVAYAQLKRKLQK